MNSTSKKIVVFASGNGSNAENIITYFKENSSINVKFVFCNKPNAKVLEKSKNLGVNQFVFNKAELNSNIVLDKLVNINPDLIVLAGFLLKVPENIINQFENRVINIHPALLPKYGGKGMYGMNVHEAVVNNKETETGITIHYVNKHYDEGAIILQDNCKVLETDTAADVAKKIHELEMKNFPKLIEGLLIN